MLVKKDCRNFCMAAMWFTLWMLLSSASHASVTSLEVTGDSYYYTDHFEVTIDRPLNDAWPYVQAMGLWIPWVAGSDNNTGPVAEGDLINVYSSFYVEVVKVIPEKMIVMVNLPNSQPSEGTQGIVMVTVKSVAENKTLVSIFMSRVYFWFSDSKNELRSKREMEGFTNYRRKKFKDNLLKNLKLLAESKE